MGTITQNRIEYPLHSVIAAIKFLNDSFCHIQSPRLSMQWRFSVIEAQIRVWMAHMMLFSSVYMVSNIGIEILEHIWLLKRLLIKLVLFDAGVASNGNSLFATLYFVFALHCHKLHGNLFHGRWQSILPLWKNQFVRIGAGLPKPQQYFWKFHTSTMNWKHGRWGANRTTRKFCASKTLSCFLTCISYCQVFPKLKCKVFVWNLVSLSSYHIFLAIQYDTRWRILLHSVFQITSGCMKPTVS